MDNELEAANSPPAVKNSKECSLNTMSRQIVTTDKKFNAISLQRQGIARAGGDHVFHAGLLW